MPLNTCKHCNGNLRRPDSYGDSYCWQCGRMVANVAANLYLPREPANLMRRRPFEEPSTKLTLTI